MAVFVIICPPVTNSEMKGWRGKGGKKFFCLLTTLTRFTIFAIFTLLYDFYMITSFTLHGKLTIYIVLFHLTVFYHWIHKNWWNLQINKQYEMITKWWKHPLNPWVVKNRLKKSEYAILDKSNEPNLSSLPKSNFKAKFGSTRP